MAFGWDDVAAAALLYYQNRQASKKPNFYNVPNSPEQQWQFDATKKHTQFANDYAKGLIGGFNPNPTGFSFVSDALKGQPFAGGMTLPNFSSGGNAGAIGTTAGTGGTPAQPGARLTPPGEAPPLVGGSRPNGSTQPFNRVMSGDPTEPGGGGNPGYGEDIYSYITRSNPTTGDLNRNFPSGWVSGAGSKPGDSVPGGNGATYGDGNDIAKIKDWTVNYMKEHPGITTSALAAAATAMFGPVGGLIVKAIGGFVSGRGGGGGTAPTGPAGAPPTNGGPPVNGGYLP